MEIGIIITYYICDNMLKNLKTKEDPQEKMTNAEIMTAAITASMFFGGNLEKSRTFLKKHNYMSNVLSKSQFNRRLHAISKNIWKIIFAGLAECFKKNNFKQEYAVDSFPVSVCKNIRINNCKLYKDKKYRGRCVSKREYFYGIKVHMIVTIKQEPAELVFTPGSYHDSKAFKFFNLDLPANSTLYGDSAYIDYAYEDLIREASKINFLVTRKSSS